MKKNLLFFLYLTICFSNLLSGLDSNKKTVLVAGGAGFLGSNLCEELLSQGCNVICLDNLQTGRLENISKFVNRSDFLFVLQDFILLDDLNIHLDEIYHLACPASPPHYQKDPIHTTLTNVVGSYCLLELAKKYDAKIFLASTSEVYGDPLEHPQSEEYRGNVNPHGPRSCYDEGKRCAESLFFDYHRLFGTDIKVARIFNTYGPKMDPEDGRVVSNLIMQAINNRPITIYGTGNQTRSFCFVSDLIKGFIALMATDKEVTGPINLGNPVEFDMIDLAHLILEKTGSQSEIIFKPLPIDDPKMRRPNIALAKEKLGWQPEVSLSEGLDKTIAYFKNENIK